MGWRAGTCLADSRQGNKKVAHYLGWFYHGEIGEASGKGSHGERGRVHRSFGYVARQRKHQAPRSVKHNNKIWYLLPAALHDTTMRNGRGVSKVLPDAPN